MFQYYKKLTSGKQLPLVGTSKETGENAVIERGNDGEQDFYKVTTTQNNGWHRVNTYYADGSADETYER